MSLFWYRQLLRTTRKLFKGDPPALIKSKIELRNRFEASRNISNPEEIQTLLEMCKDADEFMRKNVVQATKTSRGNWAIDLKNPDEEDDGPKPAGKTTHVNFEPKIPSEALEQMKTPNTPKPLEIKPAVKKNK